MPKRTDGTSGGVAIIPSKTACLIGALKTWLAAAKITSGPILRPISKGGRVSNNRLSDRTVAEIVKACAERLASTHRQSALTSLRAGFLSAAQSGASVFKLMDISRHKSIDTLSVYVRDVELFTNHAGARLLWGRFDRIHMIRREPDFPNHWPC